MSEGSVSVIVPCFNAAATVGEAIQSALEQDHDGLEVIVIDDGSTDASADVIRSFGDRIRAEFGSNRGASAARNRGTALAHGEFIQYLDADDLLVAGTVKRRLDALRESGADVAYADWQRLERAPDGSFQPGARIERDMASVDPDPEIACATTFWAPPVTLLYRRTIVEAIGGWNEALPVIQDARFLFDAAHLGARFVHVPGIGGLYRVHGDTSLSRRDSRAFVLDIHRNGCQIQALWEAQGGLTAPRRAALAGIFDHVARNLFVWGLPEFDDAVARLRALRPGSRWHYPEMAHALSRFLGAPLARTVMGVLAGSRSRVRQMARR